MKKINFEAGTQVSPAKVTIDNVDHEVTPAVWEGNTPLSTFVLNKMQDNIEEDINTIKSKKYYLDITAEISQNTNFTIPCYYKVGENVLDVYYMGERLIRTTDTVEGNYKEIGDTGSISNIIQLDGWSAGDLTDITEYFEFVVRR